MAKAKRGRMMYVPPVIIDEIDDIKREDGIQIGAEAQRKLVKYARVGREVNRLRRLDFSRKVHLPPVRNPRKRKGKDKDILGGLF